MASSAKTNLVRRFCALSARSTNSSSSLNYQDCVSCSVSALRVMSQSVELILRGMSWLTIHLDWRICLGVGRFCSLDENIGRSMGRYLLLFCFRRWHLSTTSGLLHTVLKLVFPSSERVTVYWLPILISLYRRASHPYHDPCSKTLSVLTCLQVMLSSVARNPQQWYENLPFIMNVMTGWLYSIRWVAMQSESICSCSHVPLSSTETDY
jgi:hypothetical protein